MRVELQVPLTIVVVGVSGESTISAALRNDTSIYSGVHCT